MMDEEVGGECVENHGQFAEDFRLLAHQNKFSNIPCNMSRDIVCINIESIQNWCTHYIYFLIIYNESRRIIRILIIYNLLEPLWIDRIKLYIIGPKIQLYIISLRLYIIRSMPEPRGRSASREGVARAARA
jgi:hypothetical protein